MPSSFKSASVVVDRLEIEGLIRLGRNVLRDILAAEHILKGVAVIVWILTVWYLVQDVAAIKGNHIDVTSPIKLWQQFSDFIILVAASLVLGFALGALNAARKENLIHYMISSHVGAGVLVIVIAFLWPEGQIKSAIAGAGAGATSLGIGFYLGTNFEQGRQRQPDRRKKHPVRRGANKQSQNKVGRADETPHS